MCCKNPSILTISHRSFQNTNIFETVSVLKSHFPKQKPNVVSYRSYKRIRNNSFRTELDNELLKYDLCNIEYQHFLNIFLDILNKHAAIKKKYIRAKQSNFMTGKLSKAITKRSKLRNRFLKEKSEASRKAYNMQRNYCVNLLKKTKGGYFPNIKINNIADNKKFWQTVKPFFSDKINHRETINLIDNQLTLPNDEEIAETFNKYFCNIAKNLSLPGSPSIKKPSVELFTDPAILALEKYNDHPSITSIKNKMTSRDNPKFSFRFVSLNKTLNEVNKLNRKKASQATDMPVKIIKENKDVISFHVFHNFSNALSSCSFPTALKYAGVRPALRKDDKTDKENYTPISILPNLSKVYQRLMYDQMYPFFLIKSFQNCNAVFVKVLAQNSV